MTRDNAGYRHRQTWVGFTRFLTWTTIAVALTLALMAIFLI